MSSEGFFYIENIEMSTCLFEYAIAHIRSAEGYTHSWYDAISAPEI